MENTAQRCLDIRLRGRRGETIVQSQGGDRVHIIAMCAEALDFPLVSEDAGAADGYAVVHLLVAYRDAYLADPSVARTRSEARARAERFLRRAADDAALAALARIHSDEPHGRAHGGFVRLAGAEVFPAFTPLRAQSPGAVWPEVLESPFGFHVVARAEG
ncbi:MAG: peptidylprolyl isomerase [Myxococcota bacterium]